MAGEPEVRSQPAAEEETTRVGLHTCPVEAAVADRDRLGLAHIAVEVVVAAAAAGNQQVRSLLPFPPELEPLLW